MIAQPRPQLTVQEYLAQERQAEIKNEYMDGEVVAMTGAGASRRQGSSPRDQMIRR